MESARAMQSRIMPDSQNIAMCERIFDMKIAVHFETSSELGGDCWGMRPLSDKKLAIFNYDFSGHGISAALNVFRIHTLMQECLHAANDPGYFLEQLNMRLHPLLERNEFATMFYGVIDTESNCLLYATAAAPSPIIFSQRDQKCELLSGRGFPLGSVSNAVYEKKYVPFLPEDLLLFFSDCVIETMNYNNEMLSDQDIMKCVNSAMLENHANPAHHAMQSVLHQLQSHQSKPIVDDLTINAYWRCNKQ
jgi:sigma-B regulation protein RsbU (phosphoserine phosphatase)